MAKPKDPAKTAVIAFANQKGGVGKSMLSTQFAYYLSQRGLKVLFIDGDYQGTASGLLMGAGYDETVDLEDYGRSYELFYADCDELRPLRCAYGVNLIRADVNDMDLVNCAQLGIQEALNVQTNIDKIKEGYDFIVFDCPPSLGPVMVGPLVASQFAVAPLKFAGMFQQNITGIIETIRACKEVNPDLEMLGYVLNELTRTKTELEMFELLKSELGDFLFPTPIYRRQAILTASIRMLPVNLSPGGIKAVGELNDVFDEILRRMGRKPISKNLLTVLD